MRNIPRRNRFRDIEECELEKLRQEEMLMNMPENVRTATKRMQKRLFNSLWKPR